MFSQLDTGFQPRWVISIMQQNRQTKPYTGKAKEDPSKPDLRCMWVVGLGMNHDFRESSCLESHSFLNKEKG